MLDSSMGGVITIPKLPKALTVLYTSTVAKVSGLNVITTENVLQIISCTETSVGYY